MPTGLKNKFETAISRSAKLLRAKRKRRTVVAKIGESAARRRFAKLKEAIGANGKIKIKKEPGKKRQQALKLWEQSFGGGFCTSMKKTADFLKEKQQKTKEKKAKRRLRQKLAG